MTHRIAQCLAKCGRGPVLAPLKYCKEPTMLKVLEIWKDPADQLWKTQYSQMNVDGLEQKIDYESTQKKDFLFRMVCIRLLWSPNEYCMEMQAEQFAQLIDVLGLRRTYDFAHTNPSTFDIVPLQEEDMFADFECSAFISRFLGLYFRHQSFKSTQGVIWCNERMLNYFETAAQDMMDLAQHPLYALLATIVSLASHVDHTSTRIHSEIRKVEQRTGHHDWEALTVAAAQGSLAAVSARVSGNATSLASARRMVKLLCEMLALVKQSSESANTQASPPSSTSHYHIEPTYFTILSRRFQNMLIQLDLLEARVNIQLTALFNLVTSQETSQNLEIAKDSKTIANATRRDSSSMKILAAVTVFFLPATFIASLFSTSMFNWTVENSGDIVSSRFWVYWVTVTPLTVGTMVVCFVLSKRWADMARWEDRNSADEVSRSLEEKGRGFGF